MQERVIRAHVKVGDPPHWLPRCSLLHMQDATAGSAGTGMVALDLKSLVGRLNDLCRRQLEAAAGLTLSRGHYNVEIEHVLLKLAEAPGSDISAILRGSD
ncbi:type VI secretion system ATPase TssH, partial [Pseudoroseomonas cervicalis]